MADAWCDAAGMWELTTAAVSAFGVIFIAELGDKTQLLALGFGARHRLRTVLIGLTVGYAAASAVAAGVGALVGAALPERPIALAAGALFVVMAATTALGGDESHDDDEPKRPSWATRHVVASVAITIALAEMGDKTQLATVALATQANPIATWIGATLGEVTAGMIGALAGRRLGARLDVTVLKWLSVVLFAVVGVIVVVSAW